MKRKCIRGGAAGDDKVRSSYTYDVVVCIEL